MADRCPSFVWRVKSQICNTQHSTINNNVERFTNILACTIRLSPYDPAHNVVKLNDNLVAKYGDQVTLEEAKAMQHVAENSDISVPKIHATWTNSATQQSFIIMDFVPGQTLTSLLPSLTQTEKDDVAHLIKTAVEKLRAIPEPGYLGSTGRQACTHGMFWSPDGPDPLMSGPFENEAAFNEGLLRKLAAQPKMDPSYMKILRTLFSQAFSGHKTVLTHGDLQPKNIMIQKTGSKEDGSGSFTITLIDWEISGWYPDYWEYCMSLMVARFRPDWAEMVDHILPVPGYEYVLMQMVFYILYY